MSRKTASLTAVVVVSNVLGNFLLTYGMRRVGEIFAPLDYLQALFNPWVAGGVAALFLWMLSHMALLSCADLSFVLPVTSVGYVLAAVAGKLFLNEQISVGRWMGVVLIMTGVALVGRTPPRTTAS
ncbi:MAG: EamA family transporter [Acidobacteria bacterium]|nr:EamA family transporter [Acidobacteriota bacterium]MBI3471054.1 EamA family transporter [Candidatus Solibacter usitatus]